MSGEINKNSRSEEMAKGSLAAIFPEEWLNKNFPVFDISFAKNFAVCVCVGIRPDIARNIKNTDYQEYVKLNLSVYDSVAREFKRKGFGTEIKRDSYCVRIMCVLPLEDILKIPSYVIPIITGESEKLVSEYLNCSSREKFGTYEVPEFLLSSVKVSDSVLSARDPSLIRIGEYQGQTLCAGIGIPAVNHLHLMESDLSAMQAFEMYYFEQQQICEYQKIKDIGAASLDDYHASLDAAFRAVLMKDSNALKVIDDVIDVIYKIHYGNRRAFFMRCMNFTGELADRLRRYKLLERDFFRMQDELQWRVLDAATAGDVRLILHEFYQNFILHIFSLSRSSRKYVIEKVITFMHDNFMDDINIKILSDVACVSTNYFSHMFKNETGQNYKAYLTEIRLSEALRLITESNYKIYEISEKVGYKNVRTFIEAFKQRYGKGPGAYRRS